MRCWKNVDLPWAGRCPSLPETGQRAGEGRGVFVSSRGFEGADGVGCGCIGPAGQLAAAGLVSVVGSVVGTSGQGAQAAVWSLSVRSLGDPI